MAEKCYEYQMSLIPIFLQTDWNDGRAANDLVRSMGGPAPPPSRLRRDPAKWEENNQQALDAGMKLGK